MSDHEQQTQQHDLEPGRRDEVGSPAPGMQDLESAAVEPAQEATARWVPPAVLGLFAAAAVLAAAAAGAWAARALLGGGQTLPRDAHWLALVAAGLGLALLAAAAGRVVAAASRRQQDAHRSLRGVIDQVAALNLDRHDGWETPQVRREKDLARFLDAVRGRDDRQRALIARLADLDQETARLGALLMARDRAAVTQDYAQASVGRVASGIALLYEDLDQALREKAALAVRVEEAGEQLAAAAADARRWHDGVHDQLNVQIVALQRLGGEIQKLAALLEEKLAALQEAEKSGLPGPADIRQALPRLGDAERPDVVTAGARSLKELVAAGGSLAIQAALEVSRLGERGETLFPLTDRLKSFIADLQRQATQLEQAAAQQAAAREALARSHELLARLESAQARDVPEAEAYRRVAARVSEQKLLLMRAMADLNALAQSFNAQAQRFDALGASVGELTGRPFEVAGSDAERAAPACATGFVSETFAGLDAGAQGGAGASAPPWPSAATAAAGGAEDTAERIYDLAEFDAVAVDEDVSGLATAPAGEDQERIYDLAEFGAVALA